MPQRYIGKASKDRRKFGHEYNAPGTFMVPGAIFAVWEWAVYSAALILAIRSLYSASVR